MATSGGERKQDRARSHNTYIRGYKDKSKQISQSQCCNYGKV